MNLLDDLPSPSAQEWSALHEQARRRAQELRREAMRDFWRDADAAWAAGLDGARRSAQRLAHRLARHAQLRANAKPADHPCPCDGA